MLGTLAELGTDHPSCDKNTKWTSLFPLLVGPRLRRPTHRVHDDDVSLRFETHGLAVAVEVPLQLPRAPRNSALSETGAPTLRRKNFQCCFRRVASDGTSHSWRIAYCSACDFSTIFAGMSPGAN